MDLILIYWMENISDKDAIERNLNRLLYRSKNRDVTIDIEHLLWERASLRNYAKIMATYKINTDDKFDLIESLKNYKIELDSLMEYLPAGIFEFDSNESLKYYQETELDCLMMYMPAKISE